MRIDIMLAVALGTISVVMAVIGGIIATERKTVRVLFVVMGVLSVLLVIFQAVRAGKSQDALTKQVDKVHSQQDDLSKAQAELGKAQAELGKAQAELHDLNTGGESFPSLWSIIVLDDNQRPEHMTMYIKNKSSTRSLYSVSVGVSKGPYLNTLLSGYDIPTIPEIAPKQMVTLPFKWPLDGPEDKYKLDISARNGQFVATLARDDEHWVWILTRKDDPAVIEKTFSTVIGRPVRVE